MAEQVKVKLDTKGIDNLLKTLGPKTKRFTIADGVEYGIFQEFGSRGHPSLVPALDRVGKDFPAAAKQLITGAVNSGLATIGFNAMLKKMAFDIQALWQANVNVDTGAYKNSIHVSEE